MFSKFLTSLLATNAVNAITVPSNPTSKGQTDSWTCNQCIQKGYTWCQNQNWYLDLKATDGIPTSICCDLREVNGVKGTCTGNQDTDSTYSCSNEFASPQQAIAACPTKQSICGTSKVIELKKGETKAISTVAYGAIETEPCTWIVKSKCGAPGLYFGNTNTVTSTHAEVHVMEWDSQQVTADEIYTPWPKHKVDTTTSKPFTYWNDQYQDQSAYPVDWGQLGNIRFHPMYNTTVRSDYNMTVPGDVIQEWIYTKVQEFTAYEADLVTYNKKRKEYNGSLRLKGKQTSINYQYVDQLLPSATTEQVAYTAPTLDTIPFQPGEYTGPEIKQGDASVDIDVGFGSPTVYMYTLKDGSLSAQQEEHRQFGSMGATNSSGPYAIRLDHTNGDKYDTCDESRISYMAITLLPKAGYTQSANSELLNITVGAYEWRGNTTLTKPTTPAAPILPHTEWQLGAHSLQTAIFSTLVALTAAQFV